MIEVDPLRKGARHLKWWSNPNPNMKMAPPVVWECDEKMRKEGELECEKQKEGELECEMWMKMMRMGLWVVDG